MPGGCITSRRVIPSTLTPQDDSTLGENVVTTPTLPSMYSQWGYPALEVYHANLTTNNVH